MTLIATHIHHLEITMRYIIALLAALFLMSDYANAMDTPTTIIQQGAFTIIQSPTQTVVCTRMGNMVQCQ